MITIEQVRTDAQARAVETLAWEFIDWLRARYPEMLAEIDTYLEAQNFAEGVRDVRRDYGPPGGDCLLALLEGQPAGIVMYKDRGEGLCEMNRMYVRDTARGHGLGKALVGRLIALARLRGYRTMRLSALDRHHEALGLYAAMGFVPDPQGHDPGAPTTGATVYLHRDLTD